MLHKSRYFGNCANFCWQALEDLFIVFTQFIRTLQMETFALTSFVNVNKNDRITISFPVYFHRI